MSSLAVSLSGPRCRHCSKPFGFAVAFCPYCGTAQQAAARPTQRPIAGLAAAPPAAPPATPAPRPAAASVWTAAAPSVAALKPASWLTGKASVPTVAPTPAKAAKPKVANAPRPRRARRQPGLLTLCVLGLIAAYLLRSGPAGTLVVYATPNVPGRITVDGERAGYAGERLQLPAGTHRLGYEADGWTTAGRQARVVANEQRVVTIVLSPVPAVLVIDLQTAGATLRLDDRFIDPPQEGLRVTAGRHRLTATRPGYAMLSLELELGRGERRVVPVALLPAVARDVTRTAVFGAWSEPVALPLHTGFTLTAAGRVRLRIGQKIMLVQPGNTYFGDVHGQWLQVEAVDGQPVDVHFSPKPDG